MPKHRIKQSRHRGGEWLDANTPLSESVSNRLLNLFAEVPESEEFDLRYLRSEYLSKLCLPDAKSAESRKSAAIQKWLATEKQNQLTNARIRGRSRFYNILPRVTWYDFLGVAQRIISEILGPLKDEVVLGEFSSGASTSRRRSEASIPLKFVGQADATEGLSPFVDLIHRLAPLSRQYQIFFSLSHRDGSELFTVPKKSDIDRCACKEPDINMFLQKGVGRHIRSRLRRFNINLNDQTINQRLARDGSIEGNLATLDLSSASDTITISCVEALLPHDWFEYLNSIRSLDVGVSGKLHRMEMFSSMGNGFTFELESLLFYALMRTTAYFTGVPGIISVYGDDIIIPTGLYDDACWVLKEFGFSVNLDKSFATGLFRESCGGHYYAGVDVTPFYLRKPPTRLTDLIRIANQLRRWAMADEGRQYVHDWLYALWAELKSYIPEDLWGGRDHSIDTQLCSPDIPKKKLVRASTKERHNELGAYISWHVSNWNRTTAPLPGAANASWLTNTSQRCRKRRATISAFASLVPPFKQEI